MLQELTNACPAHQRGPHRPLHWQSGVEQLLPGPLLMAATHCLQASRQKVRPGHATLCGSVLLTDGDTVLSLSHTNSFQDQACPSGTCQQSTATRRGKIAFQTMGDSESSFIK